MVRVIFRSLILVSLLWQLNACVQWPADNIQSRDIPVVDAQNAQFHPNEAQASSDISLLIPAGKVFNQNDKDAQLAAGMKQHPAVKSLMSTAMQQIKLGQLVQASASFERALRISPKDPMIYLYLAQLRLKQGKVIQSEQLAKKGIASCVDRCQLKPSLWEVIAWSREQKNDHNGAKSAQ